jgi:hypothetical protein
MRCRGALGRPPGLQHDDLHAVIAPTELAHRREHGVQLRVEEAVVLEAGRARPRWAGTARSRATQRRRSLCTQKNGRHSPSGRIPSAPGSRAWAS